MIPRTALKLIDAEYQQASSRYPKFNSPHEGLAILQEEFEELKAEVFKNHNSRDPNAMRGQAIQVGAMAMRFLVDLG